MEFNQNLAVGDVDGDAIGCFLFGVEATPITPISYHSLAASPAQLLEDCTDFFAKLLHGKRQLVESSVSSGRHRQDLRVIEGVVENLPSYIAMYLTSDRSTPFLEFGGLTIFLRTGVRERQKVQGRYIE